MQSYLNHFIFFFVLLLPFYPASWSSGNAFISGSGGLSFKSRPVKLDAVLLTARHRCDISKGAVLPGRNNAEMGPANSLHASATYVEYNERFDFDVLSSHSPDENCKYVLLVYSHLKPSMQNKEKQKMYT